MTKIVGFTGTRQGMTQKQIASLCDIMADVNPNEVHHGDCIGADAQFHTLCKNVGMIDIVIHPATNDKHRAFCQNAKEVRTAYPFLVRDQHIVDAADVLIATPKTPYAWKEARSGTWATIRKARKKGMPIYIINPDGVIRKENVDEANG